MAGKLGYQAIGTVMESMANNWSKDNGIFSRVVLGVGPVNLTFGKGQKLIQFWENIENIIGNAASLGNAAFGAKLGWDWENLTLTSAGGLGNSFFPRGSSGLTIFSVMGNSGLSFLMDHELHHLWQERATLHKFFIQYLLNGIISLFNSGDFFDVYNINEQIPNNDFFWKTNH